MTGRISTVTDRVSSRHVAMAAAKRAWLAGSRTRASMTPREAAKGAWYPGHPLVTVEAIEGEIIRRRIRHCSGCAAMYDTQRSAA